MKNELDLVKLYSTLADWWPILSRPEDYAGEAEFFIKTITSVSDVPTRTMFELGCGGT